MCAGMGIVFFYAVLGGMKGITYTPGSSILCPFRLRLFQQSLPQS